MKNAVLWDEAQCGSCKNRSFGETCRLHLQGRRKYTSEENLQTVINRHRFLQDPHGATSQKRAFFIVTAVKTSNPINYGKFKHFSIFELFITECNTSVTYLS
jgi:hypothetical protein